MLSPRRVARRSRPDMCPSPGRCRGTRDAATHRCDRWCDGCRAGAPVGHGLCRARGCSGQCWALRPACCPSWRTPCSDRRLGWSSGRRARWRCWSRRRSLRSPQTGSTEYAALAAMLALLVGLVFFVARLVRLGWIADYFSQAVLVGYITGVAVVLILGQISKLVGIVQRRRRRHSRDARHRAPHRRRQRCDGRGGRRFAGAPRRRRQDQQTDPGCSGRRGPRYRSILGAGPRRRGRGRHRSRAERVAVARRARRVAFGHRRPRAAAVAIFLGVVLRLHSHRPLVRCPPSRGRRRGPGAAGIRIRPGRRQA